MRFDAKIALTAFIVLLIAMAVLSFIGWTLVRTSP